MNDIFKHRNTDRATREKYKLNLEQEPKGATARKYGTPYPTI